MIMFIIKTSVIEKMHSNWLTFFAEIIFSDFLFSVLESFHSSDIHFHGLNNVKQKVQQQIIIRTFILRN